MTKNNKHNNTDQFIGSSKEETFIPSVLLWSEMYDKWHKKMAASLRNRGSASDCEEAVQDAFLKVMGLHPTLRLSDPLVPKTEGGWYGFVRFQAMGALSHMNERSRRFAPLKEYKLAEGTFEEDDWGDVDDADEPHQGGCGWSCDREWLHEEFHRILRDLCREKRIRDYRREAFVRFELDDESGEEVVRSVPEIKNANNLYQLHRNIMKLIEGNRDRFFGLYREMIAA